MMDKGKKKEGRGEKKRPGRDEDEMDIRGDEDMKMEMDEHGDGKRGKAPKVRAHPGAPSTPLNLPFAPHASHMRMNALFRLALSPQPPPTLLRLHPPETMAPPSRLGPELQGQERQESRGYRGNHTDGRAHGRAQLRGAERRALMRIWLRSKCVLQISTQNYKILMKSQCSMWKKGSGGPANHKR